MKIYRIGYDYPPAPRWQYAAFAVFWTVMLGLYLSSTEQYGNPWHWLFVAMSAGFMLRTARVWVIYDRLRNQYYALHPHYGPAPASKEKN